MNRADVHPEHLLERGRSGSLTPAETGALQAHLRQCEACRLEASLHAALQTTADDTPLADRLIDAAMSVVANGSEGDGRTRLARGSKWLGTPALVAVLVGAGVAAAAASAWLGARSDSPLVPAAASAAPQVQVATSSPSSPRLPPAAPDAPSKTPVLALSSDSWKRDPKATSREPAVRATPAGLFAEATAARRSGEASRAAGLYRKLQQDFPSSAEAGISRLALGRLELHQLRRPAAALREFEAYLAAAGSLQQEAQLGKAQALDQLGREAEARAAYRLIVERYPDSLYAEQAKLRLERGK